MNTQKKKMRIKYVLLSTPGITKNEAHYVKLKFLIVVNLTFDSTAKLQIIKTAGERVREIKKNYLPGNDQQILGATRYCG